MSEALRDFVHESNRIEGIRREPRQSEMDAYKALLALNEIHVADLIGFVGVVAPGQPIRTEPGMNVRVGSHIPPSGGPHISDALIDILTAAHEGYGDPAKTYRVHHEYETLHPFMDGNGRSGRALWLWMMGGLKHAPLGFLHHWYYQSLQFGDAE